MNTPKNATAPILIDGNWRQSETATDFQAYNPSTRQADETRYPVSNWSECDRALSAAAAAAQQLRGTSPDRLARFLERFADRIEQHSEALVATAHRETALPVKPRLAEVELPRTIGQLRQAAAAAREASWATATIDRKAGIRSMLAPIGPVCVFGPNNFPFAFNSSAGGDFAAAIAAGNPVIAKANTSHPGTTRLFTEQASQAAAEVELPAATVQLLYRTSHDDGLRLVADRRLGAVAYTGSRDGGLRLKQAADAAGVPIYLELSSINPVIVLAGALAERGQAIAEEYASSCLMGTGQFCTNPGLLVVMAGADGDRFVEVIRERFANAPVGTLLSQKVEESLAGSVRQIAEAGAKIVTGGSACSGGGYSFANTLLQTSASKFLADPERFQVEAFGNAALVVMAESVEQVAQIVEQLEGNLTGAVYSHTGQSDDAVYDRIAPVLRQRVGRLLNDKMPTGVAVSSAMNHGGPYPATGHPGFTAVGIPAAMRRFAALECYDNVRAHRLPSLLSDQNPGGRAWRLIDGVWTRESIA